ncbi:hypothetical protein HPP92_004250 [Vanilla planifolia]|uniref:Uncharacterized protein n=1 Tax=Vanilla planifolia TaxID=51239 RepID=A0A835S1F2_VANPL|nr:hypothetical protein HPP92_004250 [Vanilla planifolia]
MGSPIVRPPVHLIFRLMPRPRLDQQMAPYAITSSHCVQCSWTRNLKLSLRYSLVAQGHQFPPVAATDFVRREAFSGLFVVAG